MSPTEQSDRFLCSVSETLVARLLVQGDAEELRCPVYGAVEIKTDVVQAAATRLHYKALKDTMAHDRFFVKATLEGTTVEIGKDFDRNSFGPSSYFAQANEV